MNINMKKYTVLSLAIVFLFGSTTLTHAELNTSQVNSIISLLQAFGADQSVVNNVRVSLTGGTPTTTTTQIKTLQEQVKELKSELAEAKIKIKFTETLYRGISGDKVIELQEFLKQFPDIYPEGLVTGYFGPLTETAVQKLQEKHDIVSGGTTATTGYGQVGPKTRAQLNSLLTTGAGSSGVTPPGLLTAPGIQKKLATSTSPVPPTTATSTTSTTTPSGTTPAIPATPATPSGGGGGGGGGATPATPATPAEPESDTTSPVISNIQTTSVAETSVTITWDTDELADSKVDYAFNSPITTASSTIDATTTINHSINLSSLGAGTTHYYVVVSKDGSSNTATSSEQSFTTLTPPLPPAPSFAEWDNIQITSLLDNGNKISGLSFDSGSSNYGLIWTDNRDGFQNIYFNILDSNGNKLTQDIKVSENTTSSVISSPKIIWSGNHYAIFWSGRDPAYDYVNDRPAFFALFDEDGNRLQQNVRIHPIGSQTVNLETSIDVVWSGTEYAMVYKNKIYQPQVPEQFNVVFQRLSSSGGVVGPEVTIATDILGGPRIVWTGTEYGITWGTSGDYVDREIYFTRINTDGEKQGGDIQISFCGSDWCSWPDVLWDGSSYIIRWNNISKGEAYLSKVNSAGAIQSTNLLTDNFHDNPKLIWSGSEYGAVWNHHRGNNLDVLDFVKLNSSGIATVETKNLIDYSDEPLNLYCSRDPEISYQDSKYAVVWIDSRDNSTASCAGEIYFATGN